MRFGNWLWSHGDESRYGHSAINKLQATDILRLRRPLSAPSCRDGRPLRKKKTKIALEPCPRGRALFSTRPVYRNSRILRSLLVTISGQRSQQRRIPSREWFYIKLFVPHQNINESKYAISDGKVALVCFVSTRFVSNETASHATVTNIPQLRIPT